jgi:hypothetical protein
LEKSVRGIVARGAVQAGTLGSLVEKSGEHSAEGVNSRCNETGELGECSTVANHN